MKVYYYNDEYEPNKHKIRKAWAEFMGINMPDTPVGCSVLELDESYNRKLAQALATNSRDMLGLPDKIYVDGNGDLRKNSDDSLILIEPNPQKEAYKLSQLYGLTHEQLDTYIDNNMTDLASAKEIMRKALHVILWLVKQTKLDEQEYANEKEISDRGKIREMER